MVDSRVGMTTICGINCPYCYEEDKERITVYTGNKSIEIPDGMDKIIGQRFGVMSGGYSLYKLSVPLSNDCLLLAEGEAKQVSAADQNRFVDFVIDDYRQSSKYTEMRIQFSELDYFLPSCNRVTVSEESIVFSRITDTVYDFDIQYHDSTVSVSFNRKTNGHSGVLAEAKTTSEVVFNFPETYDLNYLMELYSASRMFFFFFFCLQ